MHCVNISIHALLAESDHISKTRSERINRFLSTLSLRRATKTQSSASSLSSFLSTLSLRRATHQLQDVSHQTVHFYPRSPCGERRQIKQTCRAEISISIHALLAESDVTRVASTPTTVISIHALLAESDRTLRQLQPALRDFYPRSPCGERQNTHSFGGIT